MFRPVGVLELVHQSSSLAGGSFVSTPWDRVILGFCALLVSPRRVGRAVILKGTHEKKIISQSDRIGGAPANVSAQPEGRHSTREVRQATS